MAFSMAEHLELETVVTKVFDWVAETVPQWENLMVEQMAAYSEIC